MEEVTAFQLLKIVPPAAQTPPPPIEIATPIPPQVTLPITPLSVITSNLPAPKFDMPTPKIEIKMPNFPATTSTQAEENEITNTQEAGSINNITVSSYNGISQLLKDYAKGDILGICTCGKQLIGNDAKTVDKIRRELFNTVGWIIGAPFTDKPGIKYGNDVPSIEDEIAIYPKEFIRTERLVDAITQFESTQLWTRDIHVILAVWDIRQEDGVPKEEIYGVRGVLQNLRDKKIKLCVIMLGSSKNPSDALPKIMSDYIAESGGAILYTDDMSTNTITDQIKNTKQ